MTTRVAACDYLGKTKSSTNPVDQIKLEQLKLEEQLAVEYINKTLGVTIQSGDLQKELKDGVVLCNLVNQLKPGTIKGIGQKDFSFVQMDNITRFLQGVRQVVHTILSLAELSLNVGSDKIKGVSTLNCTISKSDHDTPNSSNSSSCARPPKSPLRHNKPSNTAGSLKISSHKSRIRDQKRRPSAPVISNSPFIRDDDSKSNFFTKPSDKKKVDKAKRATEEDKLILENSESVASPNTEGKISLLNEQSNVITNYQLGNCIGKGQFGSVYRTLDLLTGEVVAVKRVKLDEEELYEEIMKEANILKSLSHANVIKYIGFIRSEDYIDIVLEYAENGSLMSTLKAFGEFPERLVASFCIKILEGLEYLHTNDVVHCDLKAANILTTKTGDVKLTDFGVSFNLKTKSTHNNTVSGTPNWMAPEVIELKGATTKSDIWSLGCTLIELVTGKPPYSDLLPMSAMFHIVEDEFPPLPDNISEDMCQFLKCCFQKDPIKRPSSSDLQKHDWLVKSLEKKQSSKTNVGLAVATDMTSITTTLELEKYYSSNATAVMPVLNEENNNEDNSSHRFSEYHTGKSLECKVCIQKVNQNDFVFCEICSLLCHKECKKDAFSCPPKVNDQQPSYDWVFLAKVYNTKTRKHGVKNNGDIVKERGHHSSPSTLRKHPSGILSKNFRGYSQDSLNLSDSMDTKMSEKRRMLKKGQDECVIC
ncbi:kinase-like domain-containing protein [Sporodiniella umbellata]|nr:kinase-like domain-containing protein [Sporodiniella umbellata]